MEFDDVGDFFGEDDLFGDTDVVGDDEAIEDNRYDGKENGKDEISDFLKKEKKVAAARKKTNPRALLNERSLLLPQTGIHSLKKAFINYKPDAKDDPYSHLPEVLKKYQHWAHILAPRLKFEDVIARCEQLGDKRAIRVHMQKMRMGMPLTDEDFEEEEKRTRKRNGGDSLITTEYRSDNEDNDDYSSPVKRKDMNEKISSPTKEQSVPIPTRSLFGTQPSTVTVTPSTQPVPLTEEERRKIAENRIRAMELRAKREAEEKERIEKEKNESIPNDEDIQMNEDEIMAQFDIFE